MTEETKKPGVKKRILIIIAAVGGIIAGYFIYQHILFVSTDDAYVQAHTVMLAARVSGVVDKVLVDENQKVKAGQLLVQLDDRDYKARVEQAVADGASLQAQYSDAERTFGRVSRLFKQDALSRQDYDRARYAYEAASERIKGAASSVDLAKLNLSYTRIVAPEDGMIAKRSIEPGAYVPVGQPLVGFVSAKERWVLANFKETELSDIHIGSKASIFVDAVSGEKFHGEVESISPSTGATFALLPPDNATGNFTKVVQRVPVKIKILDLSEEQINKLQAGLSAVVDIRKK